MRYADNRPTPECKSCVEAIEAAKCRNCEGRTLKIFIRWHVVLEIVWAVLMAFFAFRAKADVIVLTNRGFTAWYDASRRIPAVVEYDLEPEEVIRIPRIPYDFTGDPRVPLTDFNFAYRGSGYDRGHMAPAADFNWSSLALRETYYFSNIAPQSPQLNRGKWLEAESDVRRMAASGTVHVITVAIPGTNWIRGVNVPSEFHKFAVGKDGVRHWVYENR